MSKPTIPLTPGKYFHIYNRGINSCPIFYDDYDHERFLYLYQKYVGQIAETFAWVLMRTHFHLLIRIKEDMVYRYSMEEIRKMEGQRRNANRSLSLSRGADAVGFPQSEDALSFAKWEMGNIRDAGKKDSGTSVGCDAREQFPDVSGCGQGKTPNPSLHLGHLFNAYARYFNPKYHRHGSLFENQFKRKPIEDERYLLNVMVYIHKNPEHHGYCSDFRQYPWSSYHASLQEGNRFFGKEEVLEWFGSFDNFILAHSMKMEIEDMES
ncbi:hypothetical protein [Marinilabilia salmonicolor]|uniref:Transposase IS200-like domain-containing protein n=1 Tax=Marinilabilia salmonicolor TaxID=989 RepID=A0A368UVS0_9BACT|nr:hypothetical protein [Marinilabilia salmonicolor]RCW32763.1 hypothetical protein DFO77_11489 [Marinilabilia salmonicolor]